MNYQKNYIGKGKQIGTMEIVKIVIPVEEAEKAMFEKEGVKYYGFEVAKMKEADKFGRTHTCYYTTKENTPAPEPSPAIPPQENEDDLPF